MRVLIVTDAWHPQVNGVVTTLTRVGECLQRDGHEVRYLTPDGFSTLPLPSYPEIRIAVLPFRQTRRVLDEFAPDAVHIATEGPLGHAARRYCLRRRLPFTTAYHTRFPQYVRLRTPIPVRWSYAYLRRFHAPAVRTLVPTPSIRDELAERGFTHLVVWGRGVDTELFRPRSKAFLEAPRPISMFMGRVAGEKNIEAFLQLDLPGTKYVVGDGPDLRNLRQMYPDVRFVGFKHGEELAQHVAAADVFVFPSRTDTYGLTMLEAMACGVPVAAYPVSGPKDVVVQGVTGCLDEDLRQAVLGALTLDPVGCTDFARERTWRACAAELFSYLAPIRRPLAQAAASR